MRRGLPVKAKQVRNDTGRLKRLLAEPAPVYASLAPSWVSEFKNVTPGQLIRALKLLGFAGVSETALGAPARLGAGRRGA